jgi:hypothetical protein
LCAESVDEGVEADLKSDQLTPPLMAVKPAPLIAKEMLVAQQTNNNQVIIFE